MRANSRRAEEDRVSKLGSALSKIDARRGGSPSTGGGDGGGVGGTDARFRLTVGTVTVDFFNNRNHHDMAFFKG